MWGFYMAQKKRQFAPEIVKTAKEYNLIDDILFTKAAENKDFCQEILRTVCEDPELVVIENTAQRKMQNLAGRSVVFDAICKLKNKTLVNIEVQKANDDDHQRRVRYNGAVLAANVTKKNTKFKDVPNVIVVFISSFDLFKRGYALYHVDRVIRETKERVENGLSEIYVNAAVKDESNVAELMRIFVELKAYNERMFPVVSNVKKIYKETEEGIQCMCALTEKLYKKGEARGIEKGRVEGRTGGFLESIRNMVEGLNITENKAMDILKIPENERSFYIEKLKEMN